MMIIIIIIIRSSICTTTTTTTISVIISYAYRGTPVKTPSKLPTVQEICRLRYYDCYY